MDPYAPIEKRSLFTADVMKSRAFSVRLSNPQAPTGWDEVGVVSEDYLLVPNAEVRQIAHEIVDRSGLPFREERVRFDGKRFSYALTTAERGPLEDVRVGDPVGLGLLFENSYDGSKRLSASLFAYRLACKNGMLARDLFRRVAFKHQRHNADWEHDMAAALSMLRSAPVGLRRFAEAGRALTSMRVSASRLREVRESVLPEMPVTLWGKTIDRFLLHEQLDGYGLLNAATNLTWHDERATASVLSHNEYATSRLVEYALGDARLN